MDMRIKRFDKTLPLPEEEAGAAGFDFSFRESATIQPGEIQLVSVNVAVEIPKGYFMMITLRSSTPMRRGLMMPNAPGIIDPFYRLYKEWGSAQKPALWAYKGDVYKGVKANNLTQAEAEWAQQHIMILSGLYGILRPYDTISPYRLEMKAKLAVGQAKSLYEYWDDRLAKVVAERANGIVCVLSSDEYAKAVVKHLPKDIRIVTPVFYDVKPSRKVGVAPIYSKMMRGVMARWIIDNKVDTPEELKHFTGHGYIYDASRSSENMPAFFRKVMTPLVFD